MGPSRFPFNCPRTKWSIPLERCSKKSRAFVEASSRKSLGLNLVFKALFFLNSKALGIVRGSSRARVYPLG